MLVSIVGHASFHTAGSSGPSIIERSYFFLTGAAGGIATGLATIGISAVESVTAIIYASASVQAVFALSASRGNLAAERALPFAASTSLSLGGAVVTSEFNRC